MEIKEIYQLFLDSTGVCTDTRKLQENQIYFALKGDNFDGNKFAKKAIECGASYAVVDDTSLKNIERCIIVDDVLKNLQSLANFHRKSLENITIIGITGSNGKTTTKKLIYSLLGQKFKTQATIGNLNNHIGVPLTLLSFRSETQFGIVEMGANHQKEIDFLCQIAEPEYGIITNFGKAHLEGFGGVEGVIKGKSELYQHLNKTNGVAFIYSEDSKQVDLTENMNRIQIGSTKNADYQFELIESFPSIKFKFKGEKFTAPLSGDYNYQNIINAMGVALHFGVDVNLIKTAIENFEPEENRSQFIKKDNYKILLDAYNANPSSMKASIVNFSQFERDKTLILGDMFELGKDSLMEHYAIFKLCKQQGFNNVYFCGQLFYEALAEANLPENYHVFQTYQNLENQIKLQLPQHQLILIKGSRGMQLERILDAL